MTRSIRLVPRPASSFAGAAAALVCAAASFLPTPSLQAQAPPPPPRGAVELLPKSTYAAFHFAGLGACTKAANGLPLAAVLEKFAGGLPAESRGRQMLDQGIDRAVEQVRTALQRAGLEPADVRAVLSRPAVLGVGRLTIEGMGPSVALVVEVGDAAPAMARLQTVLEHVIARSTRGETSAADEEIGGVRARRFAARTGPPLFSATVAGCFVLTNSRGYLAELAAVAKGATAPFAATALVEGARELLPQPPLASACLHVQPFTHAFAPLLPYEAEAWGNALGVAGFDGIWAGVSAAPDGAAEAVHFAIAGDPKGLLKAAVAAPADLGFAKLCSANTIVFGAGSFDVAALVDASRTLFALLPEELRREIERELDREMRRELKHAGTSPEEVEALLRAFGNQVSFAISLAKGVPMPELVVRIAVRDEGRVAELLRRLEVGATRGGIEWRTRKVGEREIRYCSFPIANTIAVSPAYVFADGALLIANDARVLARTLNGVKEGEATLAAEPDFVAASKENAGASALLHVRLFRAAEIGWPMVETMLYPQIDAHAQEIGFTSESLPDSETIAKALGCCTTALHVGAEGVSVKSRSAFGAGAFLAAIGYAADEVLRRAGTKVF